MGGIEETQQIVGSLGIIAMNGCERIAAAVDRYLGEWRTDSVQDDSFVVPHICPRFSTGEGKSLIKHSVRGYDIFIIADCFNYGVTYKMYGQTLPMSPDDHFQDIKRVISACGGKARRITLIMPMLYEGRQHRRMSRESLDCAMALQELAHMGVANIITFDAHDSRVQNAIPHSGFEDVHTAYQMIKALTKVTPKIKIDRDNLMMISPDEGGVHRCIYYSTVLGVDLGMFYKRRDYSVVINGRNPIVSHEFLGSNVRDKDVIVVDDMISSGESVLDIAAQLKELGASRVFICAAFGLFVDGLDKFDKAYEDGMIDRVFTTNAVYSMPGLHEREWYTSVDMSKYIAYIINTLNHDGSLHDVLNPSERINRLLEQHG